MKIQPAPCCSGTYGRTVQRLSIVLLMAAAMLLVVGMMVTRRDSGESILVEEKSPRAVASKLAGTYSVQAGDMRDAISLLVMNRDGVAIPLDRLDAYASYAPRGGEQRTTTLEPMNDDHLMAAIDPSQAGTLVVNLAIEGVRHELTFELPFSPVRRPQWDS